MSANDVRLLNRRALLKGTVATAAGLSLAAPFEALARGGGRARCSPDYGELVPTVDETTGLPLLELPRGFRYFSFSWTGDAMIDGRPVPGGHDGGAVVHARGSRVIYVRNHELGYSAGATYEGSFADPGITFDASRAPGGTTNVELDLRRGRCVRTWPSLSGTIRNCAGGLTPWGSWLTCEEDLTNASDVNQRDHGWVFEVPAFGRALALPLEGLGRFNHEACAVDPRTGIVYETEDTGRSGIYRFVPRRPGDLLRGGQLQMLRIVGQPGVDTTTGIPALTPLDIDWVDIDEPGRRDDAPGDGAGVFAQGFAQGGASFRRGEGMWYGDGKIYFSCTSGGAAGEGQIWELDPARGHLRLIFESPSEEVLDNPDNIAVTPGGGLILCEDGDLEGQQMRGLSPDGVIFPFAQNGIVLDGEVNGIVGDFRGREWAGACFTPDGRWLIASIQTPGVTFAITGPWQRGAL